MIVGVSAGVGAGVATECRLKTGWDELYAQSRHQQEVWESPAMLMEMLRPPHARGSHGAGCACEASGYSTHDRTSSPNHCAHRYVVKESEALLRLRCCHDWRRKASHTLRIG